MRDISVFFKGELPPNFRLMEDQEFVSLYKEKLVAIFSASGTNPEAIIKTAEDYLRHQK